MSQTYREKELQETIAVAIETGSYLVPQNGNQLKEAIKQAAWIARNIHIIKEADHGATHSG